MSFWTRFLFVVCLGVALGGCAPSDQDEEKEPHYVLGQSKINEMDYQGAVDAFEESLEVNPHSAAAHYQLAMLYENQESDPAAAIYHYEQYLKFDPTAENADIIRQHIAACKQQLAADVLPLPSAPEAQEQLEKLVETGGKPPGDGQAMGRLVHESTGGQAQSDSARQCRRSTTTRTAR
jgi:tetratricopeptide (TPR) repeat protein